MTRSRKKLPSLGALTTFNTAAKHLSFTRSAAELNITQAAVSRQVRFLEESLGVSLFRRKHRSIELTREGQLLLSAVNTGLDHIASTIAVLSDDQSRSSLTISTTLAFANFWLMPRLHEYRKQRPDLDVRILASDDDDTLQKFDAVDISFVCGNERSNPGDELYYLFEENVYPVCSAPYLERSGPFDTPASLLQADLIHLDETHWTAKAIGWTPISWGTWFSDQGVTQPAVYDGLSINNYQILVETALQGHGVILGWQHLVQAYVDSGRLVVAHPAIFSAHRGYFLLMHADSDNAMEAVRFKDWLRQQ